MFRLYVCGPDNRSTWAECCGHNATRGREIKATQTLCGLIESR